MAGSTPTAPGRIFLSYRRDETEFPAGWLYERLAAHFSRDQVFRDVDSIELGDEFAETIANAVGSCDVLLALIGDQWLTITDEAGNRRLDDPNDFVRLEIEAALERGVRVIPILVGNVRMPRIEQMPASLAGLARRQALQLSPNRFESDTGRLLGILNRTLARARARREAEEQAAREADSASVLARHPAPAAQPAKSPLAPKELRLFQHPELVVTVAFSPDGRLLATAGASKSAWLWEVASGQQRARLRHKDTAGSVAFSPDGRLLAATSGLRSTWLWEVASGQVHARLPHGGAPFAGQRSVAFSPDGPLLATAGADRWARLWEVASGQEGARLTHDAMVLGVAFSPDGRLLATAGADGSAWLWEVASGHVRARLSHHEGMVFGVAFSPDGRLLGTAGGDKTARLWEVASGQEHARLAHNKKTVIDAAFSPNGRLLATTSGGRSTWLWEVASGQQSARLRHDGGVQGVAFSPDGFLLAIANLAAARLWSLFADVGRE
jgi:sugar lactone lactonase YvrE